MFGIRNILFFLGSVFAVGALALSVGVLLVIYHFSRDLPDYDQLAQYDPPTATRLYAGDGKLLEEYAREKRLYVPSTSIPNRVKQAFIAAEDKNFYNHPGVDLMSIVRAMAQNLSNMGSHKGLVGGSTITQQVVKNFLLTNERSLERKVKEAILAFRISQAFSKERVLELYLNEIYLGMSSYGVAAAALNYFDKSIDDLSVEEAALLAGMPKAPSSYDPNRDYDRALKRRNYVLERMYEDDYITKEEYEEAIAKPIVLKKRSDTELVRADYFAEAVRRDLVERYGEQGLYEGGLAVRTTVDPALQRAASDALRDGLEAYDRRHGWRGVVKEKLLSDVGSIAEATGSTTPAWYTALHKISRPEGMRDIWQLAMVLKTDRGKATIGTEQGKLGMIALEDIKWARKAGGGGVNSTSDVFHVGDVIMVIPSQKDEERNAGRFWLRQVPQLNGAMVALDPHTGRVLAVVGGYAGGVSQFNRAIQGKRQPGSSFKPFVYLTALEKGFTPASIIIDAEIQLSQGAGRPDWKPENYSGDYYGPTPLRIGIERSRNTMTVRLAQMIGLRSVIKTAQDFGLGDNLPENFSIVLGAAEVAPINLAAGYGMIINGGKKIEPYLIDRIQDKQGHTIYRRDDRSCVNCMVAQPEKLSLTEEEAAQVKDVTEHLPDIQDNRLQVVDPQSAYQMTYIMQGVVERGTAMKAKGLGYTLGGKTGTTNKSFDAWFMGFSPDLVVGVYTGFDRPRTMGKTETGASVALPIFIQFMQTALKGKADKPFRIPPGIELVRIDKDTGTAPAPTTPPENIIMEAFKTGTGPNNGGYSDSYDENSGETVGTGGVY
jgi:penicillin-binding protein 1A